MNKRAHRLVFDRSRGMIVPAAEHTRSSGKAGGGESRGTSSALVSACSVLLGVAGGSLLLPDLVMAQTRSMAAAVQRSAAQFTQRTMSNLPVRSTAADRIAQDMGSFKIRDGYGSDGRTMVIDQFDRKVIINWDTFDIGANYTVQFNQPTLGSALNNIWSGDPSVILGHIKANGEVILQNRNGIIFGPTARIDTGRFVATALSLSRDNYEKGLRAIQTGAPVFGSDAENRKGFITIERGAEIKALAGGDVIMVAPQVYNEGRIETPSGQTILAAGKKVYLYANTKDTIQRGLVVAVDAFSAAAGDPAGLNTVEQAAAQTYAVDANGETVTSGTAGLEQKINQVVAEKGTINLVGMTVRQNGVLSATTAVKGQNGAIFLQAMKDTYQASDTSGPRLANALGTVELGSGSITSVTPDQGSATQTSSEAFYRSRVNIDGKDVRIDSGALVQAVSGNVQVRAAENARFSSLFYGTSSSLDSSSLVVDAGATISVAGLRDVSLPMSRNQLSATVFQIELADSPVQRNGVVYRQDVFADARQAVSLANVTGYYNLIGRTANELSIRGGNLVLATQGANVTSSGAKLDISGGSVRYASGQLYASLLQDSQGLVSLEDANAGTRYTALINPSKTASTLSTVGSYVEGADAGFVSVIGGKVALGADINGSVVIGPLQRGGAANSGYAPVYGVTTGSASLLDDELGWSTTLKAPASDPTAKAQPWLYASLQPRAGSLAIGQLWGYSGGKLLATPSGSANFNSVAIDGGTPVGVGAVPTLGSSEAAAFFAQMGSTVHLSTQQLQSSGLGNLSFSADRMDVGAGAALNLGAQGSLTAITQSGIDFGGQLRSEGGKVSLTAEGLSADIRVAPGASIDVSGRVADERKVSVGGSATASGGNIDIVAAGSVDVRGASLDVSGGYWLVGSARNTGQAGTLAISANRGATTDRSGVVELDGASLSGYDFTTGGTLKISGVRTIAIGQVPQADSALWSRGLVLGEGFFSQGGFGTFKLSAIGDVTVMSGANVTARLQNRFAPTIVRYLANESALSSLRTMTLAEGLRSGVKISLTASSAPDRSSGAASNEFVEGGSVTVGAGARVDAGLAGSIELVAGRKVDIAGSLVAHGGAVSAAINQPGRANTASSAVTSDNVTGYIPDQEIRLRNGGLIDVSGATKAVTNAATGTRIGQVLAGGSVALGSASAGTAGGIVTEAGSLINVNGAADVLNPAAGRAPVLVKQGAGSVTINTADGYALQGAMSAARPDGTVSGGLFSATVSLGGANDIVSSIGTGKPYPVAPHMIQLVDQVADVSTALNGQTHAIYGSGLQSSQQLMAAGFDRVILAADDSISLGRGVNFVPGQTASGQAAQLRSLALDTRVVQVTDGAEHTLQAAHVSLGSTTLAAKASVAQEQAASAASAGNGVLNVNAGLVELRGYLGLSGFKDVRLNATLSADQSQQSRQDGEIRLIGRTLSNIDTTLAGALQFSGNLSLTSGVTYATTLSNYTLQGAAASDVLAILAPVSGTTAATPLSALGSLTLKAGQITLDGNIHQPFGTVTVSTSGKLTVGDHANVSVSGDGSLVPLGLTVNGAQWAYGVTGTLNGVTTGSVGVKGLDQVSLLKSISLEGGTISLSNNAVLSAKSGGDLQAWEFVPGVGGSADELNKAGYYAVLPNYRYDFAPYDAEIQATQRAIGTALGAGDKITIQTDNGVLAQGSYTLLPARYALLPGAVLVQVGASASGVLSKASVRDDGSVLVSGYKGSTGTEIGSAQVGARVVLTPQATLFERSKYTLTSINAYKEAQAAAQGSTALEQPGSAGRISFASASAFDVGAHFELNGGGQLDLLMGQKMALTDGSVAASALAGYALVDVNALNASGAGSILLGGKRKDAVAASTVTTSASEVRFATSVDARSEIIATATDKVAIDDGVTLVNSGASDSTARTIAINGQGAALVLSNRINTDLTRDQASAGALTGKGDLSIGAGVKMAADAVLADASGKFVVPTDLSFEVQAPKTGVAPRVTKALSLGATKIALGGTGSSNALTLSQAQLDSLASIERLTLRAAQNITTQGSLVLGARDAQNKPVLKSILVDAPQIVGLGQSTDKVEWVAEQVTLTNTSTAAKDASLVGQSQLVVVSAPALSDQTTGGIKLSGKGAQTLGFSQVMLDTTGDVVMAGQGVTLSTQGDLTIKAARVTGTRLSDNTVQAAGVLTIDPVAADRHTLNEIVGQGSVLNLQGARLVQAGRIDLPSGKLTLSASGQFKQDGTLVDAPSVSLATGSVTDVSGRTLSAGGQWTVSTAGGSITADAAAGEVWVDGRLDVSAGEVRSNSDIAKSAGKVTLRATGQGGLLTLGSKAEILGKAQEERLGAQLKIDAVQLAGASVGGSGGSLDRLAEIVGRGQLTGGLNARVRSGSQSLDTVLKSQNVVLSVDDGSLTLRQHAVVAATAPQGGVVALFAQGDLQLDDGARVSANASRAGTNGGDVLLAATDGTVRIAPTAQVSALGDAGDALDGRIVIRASLNSDATDGAELVKVSLGNAGNLHAGEVTVEAVKVLDASTSPALFTALTAKTSSDAVNGLIGDESLVFSDLAASARQTLGLDGLAAGQGHLRLGVELRAAGDLTLVNDWNLADLRVADEPISLTVRAAGSLNVRGTLSDGFSDVARASSSASEQVAVLPGDAASFRLTAGADLNAADVLAAKTSATSGDLVIAANKMVRTTSGSIDLAAGRDVVLQSGTGTTPVQGSVYVAGRLSELPITQEMASLTPTEWTQFTEHGGRLTVAAGRDITAPGTTQLPGNWLYHTGSSTLNDEGVVVSSEVAWWSGFDSFRQGFGSFGGGNIRLEAAGNISNAGVVAPTSALTVNQYDGVTTDIDGNPVLGALVGTQLVIRNGGDVTVKAGGDIRGGVYLLGQGKGLLSSGGAITTGDAYDATKLAAQSPILALMNGQWSVQSRGDLSLGAVYNPTMNPTNVRAADYAAYFYTYGPDSALQASSAAGALVWNNQDNDGLMGVVRFANGTNRSSNWHNFYTAGGDQVIFSTGTKSVTLATPPVVRLQAEGGDLTVSLKGDRNLVLFPSAQGDISLFAAGNLTAAVPAGGRAGIIMAESDPAYWPSVTQPILASDLTITALPKEIALSDLFTRLDVGSSLHQNDDSTARIYAGGNLLLGQQNSIDNVVTLSLPKAADVEAGGNIVNPNIAVQHFNANSVSTVKAGGNIEGMNNNGGVDVFATTVAGPGTLRVEAGGDIHLNKSDGIVAIGNLRNPQLPDAAAHLSVMSGGAKSLALDSFRSRYLDGDVAAQQALVDYVNKTYNLTGQDADKVTTYADALTRLGQMTSAHQVTFADGLLQQRFIATFVGEGAPYAAAWSRAAEAAQVASTDYTSQAFSNFKETVLLAEVTRLGKAAVGIPDSTDAAVNAANQARRQALWDELNGVISLAGMGAGFAGNGNIDVAASKIHTQGTGDKQNGGISLFAPFGDIVVGLIANDPNGSGVVTQRGGSINAVLEGDFQVNSQKTFVVGVGDLTIYASRGTIDSGRGSNTSVSAPQTVGQLVEGYLTFVPGAVTTGSGLAVLSRPDGAADGDVNLFAPIGGISALDTFIRNSSGSGSVNLAGPVKGADNVKGSNVASTAVLAPAAPPPSTTNAQPPTAAGQQVDNSGKADQAKAKSGVLTVELLSVGAEPAAGSPDRECEAGEDPASGNCVKKAKRP